MRPGWRTSGEVYESFVRHYIYPNAIVLDLGCGAGGVMELFSNQIVLPVGIDPHLSSLLHSRDSFIHRVQGLAGGLPFASNTFDLIACSWVLEHVSEPKRVFAEVSRALKPGGHFVFITPNAANFVTAINRLVPRLAQAKLVRALYGREDRDTFPVAYRANTLSRLRTLADASELQIAALETIHDPTYLAVNEFAFRLSVFAERWMPDGRAVHIVGNLVKVDAPEAARI